MSTLNKNQGKPDPATIKELRSENSELLAELENAYAQLAAVIQVSQDETRVAYGELQEKVVVLEKKLFELELLSEINLALGRETDLNSLRSKIVEKISLVLPVDLAVLLLVSHPEKSTQRERDLVFEHDLVGQEAQQVATIFAEMKRLSQRCLMVSDFHKTPDMKHFLLRPDARSAAALCLWDESYVGVLVLNSRLPSNFRQDQEPVLQTFAMHAGRALEHALRLRRIENFLVSFIQTKQLSPEELLTAVQPGNQATAPRLRQLVRDWLLLNKTES